MVRLVTGAPLPCAASPAARAGILAEFHYLDDILDFQELAPFDEFAFDDVRYTALPVTHAPGTYGYLMEGPSGRRTFYASDTGALPPETAERVRGADALIMDATFWGRNWSPGAHHSVQETIEEVTGVARFQVPEWFWPAVLTAAGLVCLAFVLMKFKGVRFRRPERKKTVHRVTRKNHAFSALKQMAKALISRLSSELRYRKNKNTLAGLLVFARAGRKKGESWGVWRRRVRGNIFAGWRPRGRKKRGRKRMTRSCLWRTASTRCTTREGTALRGRSAGSTGGSWKNILRFKAFEFLYRQKVEKECDEWYNEL